ncbi:hypothetical protein PVAND_015124 [Polypedilum vanderplanki]|uniref:Uncharacterized protein n=1 Tax=Polypedilum vanderplanki TaxID=319348 RepID=A0A9J6BBP8_POLVA|nr:hypothetical protein PVAND_015124 [Polypedilum vanderplanki]
MSNYSAQLAYSGGKMMRIYLDMIFLGVTYCSCSDLSTTTTPKTTIATTTKPAITTTTKPTTTIKGATITTTKPSTTTIASTTSTVSTTTIPLSGTTPSTTTTTITTTPSTITTTVAPVINGCGLWARYNLDNEPINVGFSPGTARDGSTLYIGRGKSGSNYLPGRVLIGTGVYVPGGSEQLVNEPEYLVIPSGCQCVWTDPAAAMNHSGLVLTPDPNNFYAIGLVQLSSTQVAISSVVISPGSQLFNQAYNNAAGSQVTNTKATQVLVCETTTSTATPPVINFKNEACGVWSTMNYTNYVTTIGFSAGKVSLNNTVAWIGRGPFNSQFCAGRYEAAVGWSFVPWTRDNPAMASEFLIVPQGKHFEKSKNSIK